MRWIPGETLEQKIRRVLGENFAFHEESESNVNTKTNKTEKEKQGCEKI